jgi:hypothetical protein
LKPALSSEVTTLLSYYSSPSTAYQSKLPSTAEQPGTTISFMIACQKTFIAFAWRNMVPKLIENLD